MSDDEKIILIILASFVVGIVALGGLIWWTTKDELGQPGTTQHEQTYVPPVPVQVPGVGWVMIG